MREVTGWLLERSDPALARGSGSTVRGVAGDPVPTDRMAGRLRAFRVTARNERDAVRICPFGEVDIDTVGQIREQLEQSAAAGASRVLLDLGGATFLDSSGLHLVLETDEAARRDGWEFGLISGPSDVQRVFDLTGARARLPFLTAAQLSALLTANGPPA